MPMDNCSANHGSMYTCSDDHDICDRIWENLPYGIFSKIEFDAWLISSSIELNRVQVLGQSRFIVEIQRFVCNCATPPISRNYGLKALLCMRMAFSYTTHDLEFN